MTLACMIMFTAPAGDVDEPADCDDGDTEDAGVMPLPMGLSRWIRHQVCGGKRTTPALGLLTTTSRRADVRLTRDVAQAHARLTLNGGRGTSTRCPQPLIQTKPRPCLLHNRRTLSLHRRIALSLFVVPVVAMTSTSATKTAARRVREVHP